MSDQNEPPKRHVRMRKGRVRKTELEEAIARNNEQLSNLATFNKALKESHIAQVTEIPAAISVNTVIQAIKGDHIGRLGIIGRIDLEVFKCYVILGGGGRDYFDVRPGEFAIIGKAKKAIKDPIPEFPSGTEAPNINADTSPFGGLK